MQNHVCLAFKKTEGGKFKLGLKYVVNPRSFDQVMQLATVLVLRFVPGTENGKQHAQSVEVKVIK